MIFFSLLDLQLVSRKNNIIYIFLQPDICKTVNKMIYERFYMNKSIHTYITSIYYTNSTSRGKRKNKNSLIFFSNLIENDKVKVYFVRIPHTWRIDIQKCTYLIYNINLRDVFLSLKKPWKRYCFLYVHNIYIKCFYHYQIDKYLTTVQQYTRDKIRNNFLNFLFYIKIINHNVINVDV